MTTEKPKKLTITMLAAQLGITRQAVYKLKNRGMPVDSLTAAVAWRRRCLDPCYTSQHRIDGNRGVRLNKFCWKDY